jgi:phosphoribosylanthranilate isomerase
MTLVKICGLTRLKDAEFAIQLGAAALGFIMAPSLRQVGFDQAKAIVRDVARARHSIFLTAVVANVEADVLCRWVDEGGFNAVQFHGGETDYEIEHFRTCRPHVKIFRAREWNEAESDSSMVSRGPFDYLLLDRPKSSQRELMTMSEKDINAMANGNKFFLAGGLNSTNVASVIERFRPTGVDVASGVEEAPGVKSHSKLEAFFSAVRNAKRGQL